ncbi:MAG: DUF1800 domain-containing protein [Gemmatimonadota bacterium]
MPSSRFTRLCLALAAIAVWHAPLAAQALTPRDSALHALNRLAYGPRPGEVDRVVAMGVMHWIDQQLDPDRLPDRVLAGREGEFRILSTDDAELAAMVRDQRQERIRRQRAAAGGTMSPETPGDRTGERLRIAAQLQQLAVFRAVLSERQLREVMSDFWLNHFNVYWAKGADRFYMASYVEQVIRPHVLGRFEDLLDATAQSPAMLFYLDNWESVAQGAVPPAIARGFAPDSMRRRLPTGPNENYARELLELHTLGVDGGYTQQDVIQVARILTGWSIARPAQGGRFQFNGWAHDYGEKTVRGVHYPAGHGIDEGLRLLHLLAIDPATARHVSHQLCARFVADDPPDGCVDDAVAAWRASDGDIRAVLRAIFHSPDFWAPQWVRAKVKTPLEFVVSAVRAVGGDPDTVPRLAQMVTQLGEPLYLEPSPAGYPESQEQWVNSGALLHRMNAAVALAAGRLPGVSIALEGLVPHSADPDTLVGAVDTRLLGGILTVHTRDVLRHELADIRDPDAARTLVVGLALGGPEFQRQ